MLRPEVMKVGEAPNPPSGTAKPDSSARMQPRYTFAATTEITDSSSTMRISGRVSEISRKGCYVDSLNTLPVGTMLNLQILRDLGTFATKGKVIYVHERFGMGIVFLDAPEGQLKILDEWLSELPPVVAR